VELHFLCLSAVSFSFQQFISLTLLGAATCEELMELMELMEQMEGRAKRADRRVQGNG
jgi:hypothetical protein